jgi:hypothetical protein
MVCWRDGSTATGTYRSNRWFYVRAAGREGFIHSSWVTNQVVTQNCASINWMRASDWAIEQIGRVDPTPAQRASINREIVRWSGWCFAFVRGSWLLGSGQRIPGGGTAVAAFANYAGRVVTSGTPPRGALLFWGAARGNSAGHAALSLGNGHAVGTSGFERDSYPIQMYPVGGRPAYRGYAYP